MIHRRMNTGLGPTVALRFGACLFAQLHEHLGQDRWNEQFAFALCSHAETPEGTMLIVRGLFLPGPGDLSEQSGGGVCPSKDFMKFVYGRAWDSTCSILDIHTHPHAGVPRFSGIDEHHAQQNAGYITKHFPAPVTHAMLVFGNDIAGHDAVVYDRDRGRYRPIDRVEVLGRPLQIRPTSEPRGREDTDPSCARQRLIPGWNQEQLARLRVAIVGAGGTGAQVFQTLVSLGVGMEGWLALVDHDEIEVSNLTRIPYAAPRHVGRHKVDVARAYGRVKRPGLKVHAIAEQISSADDIPLLRAASVIIGAGDNDGVRRVINEVSARYIIPYIDLGCDIQIGEEVEAGGQARVVIPGENACLVCCGGYDPAEAALDLLDDQGKEDLARHGYVRGAEGDATPSVVNLNAITGQLGVTALLGLVHGRTFGAWDYARFDQHRGEVVTANSSRLPTCPVCGPEGVLALAGAEPTAPLDEGFEEEPVESAEVSAREDPAVTGVSGENPDAEHLLSTEPSAAAPHPQTPTRETEDAVDHTGTPPKETTPCQDPQGGEPTESTEPLLADASTSPENDGAGPIPGSADAGTEADPEPKAGGDSPPSRVTSPEPAVAGEPEARQ